MNLPVAQQQPNTLEEALLIIAAQRQENADLRARIVALDAQLRRLVRRLFRPAAETIPEIGQTVIPEVLAHTTALLHQELACTATASEGTSIGGSDTTTEAASDPIATVTAAIAATAQG